MGRKPLDRLKADYLASYVWDDAGGQFVSCVQIDMTDDNLRRYERYFQFHDPITPTLQKRRKATLFSRVMRHERLVRIEFRNDFLKQDGLCYGMNFFAYERGENIGDLRIWRSASREDFTRREARIVDTIGRRLVNAMIRARGRTGRAPAFRFAQTADSFGFTAREAEVADQIAMGLADGEICARLGFSKPTLRSHIAAIFRKSGLNRRAQLAPFLAEKNHHL